MKRNYSKELENILCKPETKGKRLFLHSCCAPCSSYVLEYLSPYFNITVFYYNPNISEEAEYVARREEQKRLIMELNTRTAGYPIQYIDGDYEPERFFQIAKGLEQCPEGGQRCFRCYELRLQKTADQAREHGADFFTTTLTISPLKNAEKLNQIGEQLSSAYKVPYLPSDFKKKDGYKRSIQLSKEYELYRQDYCGCIYSKVAREEAKADVKADVKADASQEGF